MNKLDQRYVTLRASDFSFISSIPIVKNDAVNDPTASNRYIIFSAKEAESSEFQFGSHRVKSRLSQKISPKQKARRSQKIATRIGVNNLV